MCQRPCRAAGFVDEIRVHGFASVQCADRGSEAVRVTGMGRASGTAGRLWEHVLIHLGDCTYLFDFWEAGLNYSKILSLMLSISVEMSPGPCFVIGIETTVDFYYYFHAPRPVCVQPLENILSLQSENKGSFLMGT